MDADYKALYFMRPGRRPPDAGPGLREGTHPYRIINLSSAAGIKSPIGDTVYGSIKAAVTHLTRIMANELARYGITVNAVAPGYVLTDMTRGRHGRREERRRRHPHDHPARYAMPEEMAGVINFIASPRAAIRPAS